MIRVKDPKVSLDFYCKTLGFHLVYHSDIPKWKFSVYFVAFCDKEKIPKTREDRFVFCMNTPGCIELTYNYGTEKQDGRGYNIGNADTVGT